MPFSSNRMMIHRQNAIRHPIHPNTPHLAFLGPPFMHKTRSRIDVISNYLKHLQDLARHRNFLIFLYIPESLHTIDPFLK